MLALGLTQVLGHIAGWIATGFGLAGAGALLPAGGILYLYGPYRFEGTSLAPSNEAFDASLRGRDERWGIRDAEALVGLGRERGLELVETIAMPANNHSLIFRRT